MRQDEKFDLAAELPRHGGVRSAREDAVKRRSFVRSAVMQSALSELQTAVDTTGGVLLCGERGSGREWFARAIGVASELPTLSAERLLRRAMRHLPVARPFVAVDCSDRDAIERRLFGHMNLNTVDELRVSGDSAVNSALGGVLFLRQLPDMPPRLQRRLAAILREGEFLVTHANGASEIAPVRFRLIATTDSDKPDIAASDLAARVAQTVIYVPPLRARRQDIPGLVRCLLTGPDASGTSPKTISSQAIALLAALPWRGNVDELRLVLRRLIAAARGRQIRVADVLDQVRLDGHATLASYAGTLREARESFERDYVAAVLEKHRGRMGEAAKALGLQRTNLYRKVRQLSVHRGAGSRHLS